MDPPFGFICLYDLLDSIEALLFCQSQHFNINTFQLNGLHFIAVFSSVEHLVELETYCIAEGLQYVKFVSV